MALYKQFIRNFCVSFGHLQICVPHFPLQGKQIAAVFQIKGSKTVSDLIGGKFHACPITVFPEVPSQHIGLQLLPISCGEQPLFPFFRLHLVQETCRCTFVVVQGSFPNLLSFFRARNSLATSVKVRSSQTIFIRILCTSQFVKTVGSEAFFELLEIRNFNFLATKNWEFTRFLINFQFWQGHKDLNPEPTVLE